jgi:hypothetical protein
VKMPRQGPTKDVRMVCRLVRGLSQRTQFNLNPGDIVLVLRAEFMESDMIVSLELLLPNGTTARALFAVEGVRGISSFFGKELSDYLLEYLE